MNAVKPFVAAPLSEDGGRANRIAARKHLACMESAQREMLERGWAAGEDASDRHVIEAERREIVARYARQTGTAS